MYNIQRKSIPKGDVGISNNLELSYHHKLLRH